MKLGEARRIIGSLSFPSKMPGTSYGLPATACIAGQKLAALENSVCHGCYALKDRHSWRNAVVSQSRRLASLTHPQWVTAMVRLLRHIHGKDKIRIDLGISGQRLMRRGGVRWRYNETGFHRWHDSGDLQSVEHFARICDVARATPKIKHWIPTQELRFVTRYIESGGIIPENLLVRVSGVFIDEGTARSWPTISTVFTKSPPTGAHVCPAPSQEHRCMDCRACWSPKVPHVGYALH